MVGEVRVGEGVDGEVVRAYGIWGEGLARGGERGWWRWSRAEKKGVGKKEWERDALQERRPWPTCAFDPVQCWTSVLFPEPVIPRTRMKTGVLAV